jgi:hypothetical protein
MDNTILGILRDRLGLKGNTDKEHNYKRDKSSWVKFGNGAKKKKLRLYISELSNELGDIAVRMEKEGMEVPFHKSECKQILIESYDEDGLKAVKHTFEQLGNLLANSIVASVNDLSETIEEVKKDLE